MSKVFSLTNKTIYIILIFVVVIIVLSLANNIFQRESEQDNIDNNIKNEDEDENDKNSNEKLNEVAFPYTDEEGRIRYKLMVNGNEVETENYPFKLNEEEKGSYYPIKDILNYFNIESLSNDDNTTLTTKINGNIIRVDANQGKMKYGNITLEALDGNIKTILVNNVLYVPSFFFMKLTDNSLVDYSDDGESVTLVTDLLIDKNNSGISGLSIAETNSNGKVVAGNGYSICHNCGGAGGSNVAYFDQYMVNGRQTLVKKYRWQYCSNCSGTGHVR